MSFDMPFRWSKLFLKVSLVCEGFLELLKKSRRLVLNKQLFQQG